MLIYSVKITLVVLLVVVLYMLVRLACYRPFRQFTEESIVANAKEDSNFMESIRAVQTIKLFQRENDRQNLWQNHYVKALNTEVKIACFDPKLDFELIGACALAAAVHDDILKFGMQYNTLVGDMGTSLSGGQKQRVILARALYRDPKLLFLYEATSHLDLGNESIVNANVKAMNITRVLVAHRTETVNSADIVIDLVFLRMFLE